MHKEYDINTDGNLKIMYGDRAYPNVEITNKTTLSVLDPVSKKYMPSSHVGVGESSIRVLMDKARRKGFDYVIGITDSIGMGKINKRLGAEIINEKTWTDEKGNPTAYFQKYKFDLRKMK